MENEVEGSPMLVKRMRKQQNAMAFVVMPLHSVEGRAVLSLLARSPFPSVCCGRIPREEAESLESEAFRHLLEGVLDVLVFGIVLLARGVA